MAQTDYSSLVFSFLLITLTTTSGSVIFANARNLLEISLPDLPLPEIPDLPDLSEPSLPNVELPHIPALPDLSFPSLPKVEFPQIPDLSSFPEVPDLISKPTTTVQMDGPDSSSLASSHSAAKP